MIESMSADAFNARANRAKPSPIGPEGAKWSCRADAKHIGWQPHPPDKCPICGGIASSVFRRGSLREWTKWENRNQ